MATKTPPPPFKAGPVLLLLLIGCVCLDAVGNSVALFIGKLSGAVLLALGYWIIRIAPNTARGVKKPPLDRELWFKKLGVVIILIASSAVVAGSTFLSRAEHNLNFLEHFWEDFSALLLFLTVALGIEIILLRTPSK